MNEFRLAVLLALPAALSGPEVGLVGEKSYNDPPGFLIASYCSDRFHTRWDIFLF